MMSQNFERDYEILRQKFIELKKIVVHLKKNFKYHSESLILLNTTVLSHNSVHDEQYKHIKEQLKKIDEFDSCLKRMGEQFSHYLGAQTVKNRILSICMTLITIGIGAGLDHIFASIRT
jgi:hypothetical protein